MKYSREFIEKVAEANNLVEIISQHTQLRQTGNGLMGRCPFPDHPEKTPSFSVSDLKQVYHCFGCHKKGNVFTFLQTFNGMSFPEAIEYLANRAGIVIPADEQSRDASSNADPQREKKKKILALNALARDYFRARLQNAGTKTTEREYTQKRGLKNETLEEFQIGFAGSEWDGLAQRFNSKQVSLALAEEARLVKARPSSQGYYDVFRDRLIFPILSPLGDVLGFGGRVVGAGEPKYLNSPETPVFTKGRVLYGLYHTAKYIRSEDYALVVEGYMDLVSLYQSGIRAVVASMGTALTPDQAKLIKRCTRNVVVLFDGDQAGIEAAERSLPILLAADLFPRGLILPDGQDPDDFVKANGAEALNAMITKAQDLFSLVLGRWLEGYRGEASQKVQLCDRLKPLFASIQDSRLRDLYLAEAAQKMNVGQTWLGKAVQVSVSALRSSGDTKAVQQSTVGSTAGSSSAQTSVYLSTQRTDMQNRFQVENGPQQHLRGDGFQPKVSPNVSPLGNTSMEGRISLKGASMVEITMLQLMIKNRANFEFFQRENVIEFLHHPGVIAVVHKADDVYRQDPNRFDKLTSLLINYLDQPDWLFDRGSLGSLMAGQEEEFDLEKEEKLLGDCLKRLKQDHLRWQARHLARDLQSHMDPGKLEKLMSLQRHRVSLNKGKTE
ncbi:MAG TPA: DNA primase [Pseudobdellovibrionaceae bacterium]|nr:DNA primase [Pseudobdellovibrionaceae bacterium]